MPYIHPENRDVLMPSPRLPASTPGELNYQITCLIQSYMETKGLNYSTINDIVGAVEGAKLEFYSRVARPYENSKIIQNGDVYSDVETTPRPA